MSGVPEFPRMRWAAFFLGAAAAIAQVVFARNSWWLSLATWSCARRLSADGARRWSGIPVALRIRPGPRWSGCLAGIMSPLRMGVGWQHGGGSGAHLVAPAVAQWHRDSHGGRWFGFLWRRMPGDQKGRVYTRIGLIFAMFMLGLALGARSGRRWSGSVAEAGRAIVLLEVGMSALAGVALWLTMLSGTTVGDGPAMEIAIYACVMLAGWVTGAEFPVAIGILTVRGGHAGAVVSAADTADHAGAAIGALAATVLLVPWLGVGGTALVLVALKSLLAIVCRTYLLNGSRESC